jgi:hypothetical protein
MVLAPIAFVRRYSGFTSVLLLVLLVPACNKIANKPKAKVSGKVTYKGVPLPSGTVTFFGADNEFASAPIGSDGSYSASAVPLGNVSVVVATPPPGISPEVAAKNPQLKLKGFKGSTEKTVAIPAKYSKPGGSGIGFNVSEGSQTYDIDLK